MNRPAEDLALEAEQPGPVQPGLYLIEDLPSWILGPDAPQARSEARCLLYVVVQLQPPKVRSTPERRLHLRDTLAAGTASHNAAVLAKEPHFWDYLQQINLTAYDAEIDARRARHFINRICGVSGRHQLNREPATAQRFFTLVQQPFLLWLLALGHS
ncbi:MAG: hypothetical protein PVG38_15690 [Gammaproteobacteria bacterium]|jgi:hypothetical protein